MKVWWHIAGISSNIKDVIKIDERIIESLQRDAAMTFDSCEHVRDLKEPSMSSPAEVLNHII